MAQNLYAPTNGGCYDWIKKYNVNLNQGVESTVCFLITRLKMVQELQIHQPLKKQTGKKDRNLRFQNNMKLSLRLTKFFQQ